MVQSPEERHIEARRLVNMMDGDWFADRPLDLFRLRESVPFERQGWDDEGHVRNPYVLCRVFDDRETVERSYFTAKVRPPEDAASLVALSETLKRLAARVAEGLPGSTTVDDENQFVATRAAASVLNRTREESIVKLAMLRDAHQRASGVPAVFV